MPATPFPHPSVHTTTTVHSLTSSRIQPQSRAHFRYFFSFSPQKSFSQALLPFTNSVLQHGPGVWGVLMIGPSPKKKFFKNYQMVQRCRCRLKWPFQNQRKSNGPPVSGYICFSVMLDVRLCSIYFGSLQRLNEVSFSFPPDCHLCHSSQSSMLHNDGPCDHSFPPWRCGRGCPLSYQWVWIPHKYYLLLTPVGRLPRIGQRVRADTTPSLPITSPLPARCPSLPPTSNDPRLHCFHLPPDRRHGRQWGRHRGSRPQLRESRGGPACAYLPRHHLFLFARVTGGLTLADEASPAKCLCARECGCWESKGQGFRGSLGRGLSFQTCTSQKVK